MTEAEIKEKLDRLAEWKSQKDIIELNKKALLDDVKIPADVEAIVKSGMERMSQVDQSFRPEQQQFNTDIQARLDAITIPDEIKAALAEIDSQRDAIMLEKAKYDTEIVNRVRDAKAQLQEEIEAQTRGVYDALAIRKAEIEAEFSGGLRALDENIARLKEEIVADTVTHGKTVKSKYFMAVYNRGRITWNTDMMEAWIIDHPFLHQARKEGAPSVSVRTV